MLPFGGQGPFWAPTDPQRLPRVLPAGPYPLKRVHLGVILQLKSDQNLIQKLDAKKSVPEQLLIAFWLAIEPSGPRHLLEKPIEIKDSTFSTFRLPKSLLDAKVEKCKEVTFGRKRCILAPGDRKKHQESIGYRAIREPGREKSLSGRKRRKR